VALLAAMCRRRNVVDWNPNGRSSMISWLCALYDFFPNVLTFLRRIRDLVTDAAHYARVFNSFACTTHAECNLGIGIILIQAQSLNDLFMELSDYQNVVTRTSDYKYWMPTLVKEITVLQKMD